MPVLKKTGGALNMSKPKWNERPGIKSIKVAGHAGCTIGTYSSRNNHASQGSSTSSLMTEKSDEVVVSSQAINHKTTQPTPRNNPKLLSKLPTKQGTAQASPKVTYLQQQVSSTRLSSLDKPVRVGVQNLQVRIQKQNNDQQDKIKRDFRSHSTFIDKSLEVP